MVKYGRCVVCAFAIALCLLFSRVQGQQAEPTELSLEQALNFLHEPGVEGQHLKAFQAASADFEKILDLPANKKHLENYTVFFKQDSKNIYVHMIPNPEDTLEGIRKEHVIRLHGDSKLGREILYIVQRKDLKILHRYYPDNR